MPAYAKFTIQSFIQQEVDAVVGTLQRAYAADGFLSQYTRQTRAWHQVVSELQHTCAQLIERRFESRFWTILFEYPLYRLRRRIDAVILAESLVLVIECKAGADVFTEADRRQVEEYALDLRDFHAQSRFCRILPVLWYIEAEVLGGQTDLMIVPSVAEVGPVARVGNEGLLICLKSLALPEDERRIDADFWDTSAYLPVPNVIEAATSIFAKHDVRSIANADGENLRSAAARLIALIKQAREQKKRYLLMLTGVPGSGKTLAGLDVVHRAVESGIEREGDIVYLSGNTPLVVVLREALARDEHRRRRQTGGSGGLEAIRREVRARIQHINDFLQEGLRGSLERSPNEHVIVFDEAQRAWDEKQGLEKFQRTASEPSLLLELMSRHHDWCACVCLVGGGQEINSGEEGVFGWGEALRKMLPIAQKRWEVFAPPDVLQGGTSAGAFTLGELPPEVTVSVEADLQLRVPQRCYRSPSLSLWVNHVLEGNVIAARTMARELNDYPLVVTRSLAEAKRWLSECGRGERRYGLVASSGARRLRADGMSGTLSATAGSEIAHWYLNPRGDIRSSYALEVPTNEYTCQGLELDFAGVCWGGDLLWNNVQSDWNFSRLSGTAWQQVHDPTAQLHITNSYRVLLTRAREGMVLWVPEGDRTDPTRDSYHLDATASFLEACGVLILARNFL